MVHAGKAEQLRFAPARGLQCFDGMLHLRRSLRSRVRRPPHDRETVYPDIGLDFRIAVEDLVDLFSDRFRTVQAGCRRELGGYQEIAVILFRDESSRPAHKHDDGNDRYDPEYRHRDKRAFQHAADNFTHRFRQCVIQVFVLFLCRQRYRQGQAKHSITNVR